jgi:hypothetical protein
VSKENAHRKLTNPRRIQQVVGTYLLPLNCCSALSYGRIAWILHSPFCAYSIIFPLELLTRAGRPEQSLDLVSDLKYRISSSTRPHQCKTLYSKISLHKGGSHEMLGTSVPWLQSYCNRLIHSFRWHSQLVRYRLRAESMLATLPSTLSTIASIKVPPAPLQMLGLAHPQ